MYFIGSPQVRWPADVFEPHAVPERSRDFLMTVGLPEFFDWPAYEFGVYDSDGTDLIIGEDFGYPVSIESSSGAVFVQGEPITRRWFLNGSVMLLSRFLYLIAEFQQISDDPPAKQLALARMRDEMLHLDPPALANPSGCVWARWLDEWQLDFSASHDDRESNVS